MDELRWLTFDLFADRVGEAFELDVPGAGPLTLLLADASESSEPGGRGPDGQERLQFTVHLRGPQEPLLAQGLHALHHPELGHLDLFLVPVGRDGDGTTYEAAFA